MYAIRSYYDGLRKTIKKQLAIGQTGKRVEISQFANAIFSFFALRHIPGHMDDLRNYSGGILDRRGDDFLRSIPGLAAMGVFNHDRLAGFEAFDERTGMPEMEAGSSYNFV